MSKRHWVWGLVTLLSIFAMSTTEVSAEETVGGSQKAEVEASVKLNKGELSLKNTTSNFAFDITLDGKKIEKAIESPVNLRVVNATGKNTMWTLTTKRSAFTRQVGTETQALDNVKFSLNGGTAAYNTDISGAATVTNPEVESGFEITKDVNTVTRAVENNTMGTFDIGWTGGTLEIPAAYAYTTDTKDGSNPFTSTIIWTLSVAP